MEFNELCEKAIEILKRTNTRRSAQAVFDVFIATYPGFDGYGQADPVGDYLSEFGETFYELGNAELWAQIRAWYKKTYGARKQTPAKMVTVSVGDLLEETDRAYGFDGGKITNRSGFPQPTVIWVPKSQVEYNEKARTLTMPAWLAKEKSYMVTR